MQINIFRKDSNERVDSRSKFIRNAKTESNKIENYQFCNNFVLHYMEYVYFY